MTSNRECGFAPGLWSLGDVINFQLPPMVWLFKGVEQESRIFGEKAMSASIMPTLTPEQVAQVPAGTYSITDLDVQRIDSYLKFAAQHCRRFDLTIAEARVERFQTFMRIGEQIPQQLTIIGLLSEIKALGEALDDDIRFKRLFLYDDNKSKILITWQADWFRAGSKFKSIVKDVEAATDCYALGQHTASVFHSMRVAEAGLRALARERQVVLPKNKPIEWGTWQDIIKEITDSVDRFGKSTSAGPKKDAALDFYNGALGHFHAFKDQYRNIVSHARKQYDDHEAKVALDHVREFMNGLARRLGDRTTKPIKW